MHKFTRGLLVVVAIIALGTGPVVAQALTPDEIQSQIKELLAKIADLTKQLDIARGNAASPVKVIGSDAPARHRICAVLARNLAVGAQGDDVQSLQEFLRENKYFTANPTGYFGPRTAEAVRRWQAAEGVTAAGSFGPLSRERLKIWCGGNQNQERFSASPSRGEAPLLVTFETWLSGFRVPSIYYTIDFGDGTSERASSCNAPADACISPGQNKHTYASNGTYTATLNKVTDPCPDDGDPNTPRCLAAIHSEVVAKLQIFVGTTPACTKEYKPVCASKQVVCITAPCNSVQQTYGNRCTAEADGAKVLYEGVCRSDDPATDRRCKAWFDGCNSCSRSTPGGPAACTLKYCSPETTQKPYCTAYFDPSEKGNKPPVISGISGPSTLAVNEAGTWTVRASDPEGGQLSYQVWWGDENVYSPNALTANAAREFTQSTSFSHVYASAGTYTVTMLVEDASGAQAKSSTTVKVGATACTLEYVPVCGRPAGCANTCAPGAVCPAICQLHQPKTYGNRCALDAENAQFLHNGECTANSGNWY